MKNLVAVILCVKRNYAICVSPLTEMETITFSFPGNPLVWEHGFSRPSRRDLVVFGEVKWNEGKYGKRGGWRAVSARSYSPLDDSISCLVSQKMGACLYADEYLASLKKPLLVGHSLFLA